MLLEAGANPNARDESGQTPLHRAAGSGNAEAIEALAAAGANLEARNESGQTPLHKAAERGTVEVVETLLAGYLKEDSQAKRARGTVEAVETLLAGGADLAARDNDDKLPFDYARDNEHLKGTDVYWKLNQARFE